MADNIANRQFIIKFLREELMGPAPHGKELDVSGDVVFEDLSSSFGPFVQKGTGEEIIHRDQPLKRYGIGILFRPENDNLDESEQDQVPDWLTVTPAEHSGMDSNITPSAQQALEAMEKRDTGSLEASDDQAEPVTYSAFKPSSIGISFLTHVTSDAVLEVVMTAGRYKKKSVRIQDKTTDWWLRFPVRMVARVKATELIGTGIRSFLCPIQEESNLDGFSLDVFVVTRPRNQPDQRLITVSIVNRNRGGDRDEQCLFQTSFTARIISPEGRASILPYPESPIELLDEEERSMDFLYRQCPTFAVGHGCAAKWESDTSHERATIVIADSLPVHETPSVAHEVLKNDKKALEISMAALSGLDSQNDGFKALEEVIEHYEGWIEVQRRRVPSLEKFSRHQKTAIRHLEDCTQCVRRMREGMNYLLENPPARKAFCLANRAMLLQQIHSHMPLREPRWNARFAKVEFRDAYLKIYLSDPVLRKNCWRPFQIAFQLMTIKSVADGTHPDRDNLEMLWFPTGGGKTEAYLGLAAFSIFYRRLCDKQDAGVNVIMRYTLRLLTTQQFQRAAALLTAMEFLRRSHVDDLGESSFSIGVWLGEASTPNTRVQARELLKKLQNKLEKSKFILTRCPWCGAHIGSVSFAKTRSAKRPSVVGYQDDGVTVRLICPDEMCEFHKGLPIYVIDEDVYEHRPDLIIGTVDKFAMLAWRPEARALFGIDEKGLRFCTPPSMIIQDELHLITGPLGSVVGLYEGVIERLCTDMRQGRKIKPKLIASTATIRRLQSQVKALYNRDRSTLFPPSGLEASDSFFARYATDDNGKLLPGRMYIGIHAPGFDSFTTTQARTFTAALQAPVLLPPDGRDPWWTLMVFFNSLRTLGHALSLVQSRVPDQLKTIRNRLQLDRRQLRRIEMPLELTGRLTAEDIPQAIEDLERHYVEPPGKKPPVDICLASNIIEVGMDIDRLSLMAVVGQPKTTAQYIQVTGRIGRRWHEQPGLVLTLLSPSSARDRSHFERFTSYHQRLYAQVEPSSLTPFSKPALERVLHAAMVAYVRQTMCLTSNMSPFPLPESSIREFYELMSDRVAAVDSDALPFFKDLIVRRMKEWRDWERTEWVTPPGSRDPGLLRVAGAYADSLSERLSWPTPQSMRNVDAECRMCITNLYIES